MKILDWNIYKDNKKIDSAIDFIKSGDFDIICLQEFPTKYLDKIKNIGYHYKIAEERFVYKKDRPDAVMYQVILSKYDFLSANKIEHDNKHDAFKESKKHDTFTTESIFVDVNVQGKKYRIFNTHLKCVAGPYCRMSQFNNLLENIDNSNGVNNVICGDFNTFGKPLINFFVWKYFGYRLPEITINEKKLFNTHFELNGFRNVFKNTVTFLKFPLQLDYILIPKKMKIINKKRYLKSYGSDHLPICVEIC